MSKKVENEEEKELSLELGCLMLRHSPPQEGGGNTWGGDTWSSASWRNRVWLHTARVWQGGLKSTGFVVDGYVSKYLSHRGIWPRRRSWNQELEREAKIKKSENKSRAPCVRARSNALTLEPLFILAPEFSAEVPSQAAISYSRVMGNCAGNGLQNRGTIFCHITTEASSAQSLFTRIMYVTHLPCVSPLSPLFSRMLELGTCTLRFPRVLTGSLPIRIP